MIVSFPKLLKKPWLTFVPGVALLAYALVVPTDVTSELEVQHGLGMDMWSRPMGDVVVLMKVRIRPACVIAILTRRSGFLLRRGTLQLYHRLDQDFPGIAISPHLASGLSNTEFSVGLLGISGCSYLLSDCWDNCSDASMQSGQSTYASASPSRLFQADPNHADQLCLASSHRGGERDLHQPQSLGIRTRRAQCSLRLHRDTAPGACTLAYEVSYLEESRPLRRVLDRISSNNLLAYSAAVCQTCGECYVQGAPRPENLMNANFRLRMDRKI